MPESQPPLFYGILIKLLCGTLLVRIFEKALKAF